MGLSLVCFFTYLIFLIRYGEMFYWGSDMVANTAYAVTMFRDVLTSGWTVPKPAEMLFFGIVYGITRDLWFVHLVLIVATGLTVWGGCRLILRCYGTWIGCVAFCVFMIGVPGMFRATLVGGPGVLNTLFLFLAVLFAFRWWGKRDRILLLVFLSLANLTRPDSWPCTALIILAILSLRSLDRKRVALERSDLWFLVPMAMPLTWAALGWGVFGDPLYSMNIAKAFAAEAFRSEGPGEVSRFGLAASYLPRLKTVLLDLFSISGGLSASVIVLTALVVAGIRTMVRRAPRVTLLIACLFAGTLVFYLVYALRGTMFRADYIYAVLVGVVLIASVGLGSLCDLLARVRPQGMRLLIQAGLAAGVVLFLTLGPITEKTIGDTLPTLSRRAAASQRARPAIERIVEDARWSATGLPPIILTTQDIPPSRIALKLGTGKDIYLIERIMSKQGLGESDLLPVFTGRTVYFCGGEQLPEKMRQFVQKLIDEAKAGDILYRQDDALILRCEY